MRWSLSIRCDRKRDEEVSGLKYVSHSTLELFDGCPSRYRAVKLEKVAEEESRALIEGILVHDIISDYREYLNDTRQEAEPEMIPEIVHAVFSKNPRIMSTDYFDSVTIAARTFAKHYRHAYESIVELEMHLEFSLGQGYPLFTGYLDAVTREEDDEGPFIGIEDTKTFWSADQKPRDIAQLDRYGTGFRTRFPDEKRVAVRNHFVRPNVKTEWKFIDDWAMEHTLSRAQSIVDRMEEAYRTRTYPARPGDHCSYCPISMRCAEANALVPNGHKALTREQAQEDVRRIVILDAAIKTVRASLKSFVDANGTVEFDGIAAEYRPQVAVVVDDLKALYERIGEELWLMVNVDKVKLRKLENDARLAGLWVERTKKPAFRVGRARGDEEDE